MVVQHVQPSHVTTIVRLVNVQEPGLMIVKKKF
jgi:hypothetical protein